MPTIQSCVNEYHRLTAVSDTARLDAEILLSAVIEKDRTYLYTWPEAAVNDAQYQHYQMLLSRREQGEPIAYITGFQEFWSLNLAVNTSTLIPRPETELLIELVLERLGTSAMDKTVLDLGTGTGAIALAIASECPHWQLTALEKNSDAVALAEQNRQRLGIDNVQIAASDWFSALVKGRDTFDVIVSNPPYIDACDAHLSQGDVRFEPKTALVAADSGLYDLDYIVAHARDFLKPKGLLLLEHGYQQAESVRGLFKRYGYCDIFSRKDLAGQPRVSGGVIA